MRCQVVCAVAAACLGLPAAGLADHEPYPADASVAYVVSSEQPYGRTLYRVDDFNSTPVATEIGAPNLYLDDIGINPLTREAFVLEPMGTPGWGNLYRCSLADGSCELVGSSGVQGLNSLAVGPDGTIYTRGYSTPYIWTLDPDDGSPTLLADVGLGGGSDLVVSPDGTALYSTADLGAGIGSGLLRIDLATLAIEPVGAFGVSAPGLGGLGFDEDGDLYGFRGYNGSSLAEVYGIDLDSGVATLVDEIAGAEGLGLLGAATAVVPEPATLTALLLCAAALVRRSR
jgi:hypothetical protein